jgi:hypothetical protein
MKRYVLMMMFVACAVVVQEQMKGDARFQGLCLPSTLT